MALTLKSKTPVRFEWSDGVAETTITLAADDPPDVLVEKLRRVVALAGREPVSPPVLPDPATTVPATGNGWVKTVPAQAPELPEDRRADWEYMPTEEESSGQ